MNTTQIELFLRIYEGKSLTDLADEFYISQQALSSNLVKLESELGVKLFLRTSKGLVPNSYADLVAPYFESLKSTLSEMSHVLANTQSQEKYSIIIDVNRMLLDYFPVGTEEKMVQLLPNVNNTIRDIDEQTALKHIMNNEVDLAMVSGPIDSALFDRTILKSFNYCAVTKKNTSFFNKDKLSLSDLKGKDLIITSDRNNMYQNFVFSCKSHNFTPTIKYYASDAYHLLFLASENDGVGITSTFYSNLFPKDKVNIYPIIEKGLIWTIELISKKNVTIGKGYSLWKDAFISTIENSV